MSAARQPWFRVYTADLFGNLAFRRCSDTAKAVLFEVFALAHDNEDYGTFSDLDEAAALSGRLRHVLEAALLELLKTGLVEKMIDGSYRVPHLQRSRQKAICGHKGGVARSSSLKHVPEASEAQRLRDSETQKSEKAVDEQLPSPSRAVARAAGGTPLTRMWDEHWLRTRGVPFGWQTADAVAIAKCSKLAGGSEPEVERRMIALLESPDPWLASNATPRILLSRWNTFAVRIVPLSKTEQSLRDYQAGVGRDDAEFWRKVGAQ